MLKSKLLFLILILIQLSISCVAHKEKKKSDISGKYLIIFPLQSGFEELTIKKDFTFVFRWQHGLMFDDISGTYARRGDTLILNSHFDYPKIDSTKPHFPKIETIFMRCEEFIIYHDSSLVKVSNPLTVYKKS